MSSVPRASIVWLGRAVKVERPLLPCVSTVDCARFAGQERRLGRHAGSVHVWSKVEKVEKRTCHLIDLGAIVQAWL